MKRPSIPKEEVLHYMTDEWRDSLRTHKTGLWLTTRALQLKLRARGVLTTWQTLAMRLSALLDEGKVEKIHTSNGDCWKPVMDILSI